VYICMCSYTGRPVSTRHLQGLASDAPTLSSSSTLPSDVERDKTVGTTKSSVTASPTATTSATTSATASASSSPRSLSSQRFEAGDMICIRGVEDKGGGVIRWVGTLPDVDGPIAGLEMVCVLVYCVPILKVS